MLGHKTTYYGYQGDGYGPLRDHNTMLLPREILHLGPSGPPGALVGSIGLLFNAPIQGNEFAVRGREGCPRTPSRIFSENTKSGYFFILLQFFWFCKGEIMAFFWIWRFSSLDCENQRPPAFFREAPPPPSPSPSPAYLPP